MDMNAYDIFSAGLAPWGETGISALLALLVMAVIYRIGRMVVKRLAAPYLTASIVLQHAERPLELIFPLIGLQIVWNNAPATLHLIELVRHINALLLIAALTWLGVQAIRGTCTAAVRLNPVDVADNLQARSIHTQARVISRVLIAMVIVIGLSSILMSFPNVRQVGMSLLASAGVLGLVAGIAARPVLGNLIAGLQIALGQPIRIDDVVIVEGEWGVIEEIQSAYVVVRIWDDRRLVVPLQYWVEKPFQNWTRKSAQLTGTVSLWVDYRMPLAPLREQLQRACAESPHWDGRLALLQLVEAGERAMQVRALVTAADAGQAWDLRCHVREALVDFVQREYPQYLPRLRIDEGTAADQGRPINPPRDIS
jgi:small-conductance mechanosensitive channel